jgi:predicted HTH domain antitoxin
LASSEAKDTVYLGSYVKRVLQTYNSRPFKRQRSERSSRGLLRGLAFTGIGPGDRALSGWPSRALDDGLVRPRCRSAENPDLSTAVRSLILRGRVLLAMERHRQGRASLSKAAEVAGVSISEMMDLLAEHGIPADLSVEDYREGLRTLREIW